MPPLPPVEIVGEFDFAPHVFDNGSDDRTIIGSLADGTVIKGRAKENELERGLTYRFYGRWTEHTKYGRQFLFQSFTLAAPNGQRGTVAYLQRRGSGIGRKRALAIWDRFGSESLATIRERPEEVAAAIKGLPVEKCREAAVYFQGMAGLEAVTIELAELLGGRGFPRTLIKKVMERWGNRAPNVIRENPYVLLHGFKGVGFLRTDALYLELGLPADAIERQAWCVWHCLHCDSEGNTWLKMGKAIEHLERCIAGAGSMPGQAIQVAIQEGMVAVREESGQTWLSESEKAEAEERVAECVHEAEMEGQEL